jgi:hypothetical protein
MGLPFFFTAPRRHRIERVMSLLIVARPPLLALEEGLKKFLFFFPTDRSTHVFTILGPARPRVLFDFWFDAF